MSQNASDSKKKLLACFSVVFQLLQARTVVRQIIAQANERFEVCFIVLDSEVRQPFYKYKTKKPARLRVAALLRLPPTWCS
jgi:hypothetical protein